VLQTLRAQETDEHALGKLDEFIKQLRVRAQASPAPEQGGQKP
jgi:hypothetical protein